MKSFRLLISAIAVIVVGACGGGGGGGHHGGGGALPPSGQNASPGGVWKGTDPISGLLVTGVITETGQFVFLRSDGAEYYGTVSTSGNSISGSYTGVVPTGMSFPDGSTYGSGTISGTVQERQSLSGTLTFTTAGGSMSSGSGSFAFSGLYNTGSSLSAIAGNYTDVPDNAVVNVDANGVVFSQSPVTGCIINGQISIINASYDAYAVSYTFSSCVGAAASLNGTTATGLGVLDTKANPAVAYIGVANDAAHYGLTGAFPKQ